MKSLTLFRHAKTERESSTGRDFDRRLAERGRNDAPLVGKELHKLGLDYDLILSSPAARAAETAEMAGLSPSFDERIYDATTDELLAIVRTTDDSVDRLMMVGHNPGFERLASLLAGHQIEMPTGSGRRDRTGERQMGRCRGYRRPADPPDQAERVGLGFQRRGQPVADILQPLQVKHRLRGRRGNRWRGLHDGRSGRRGGLELCVFL